MPTCVLALITASRFRVVLLSDECWPARFLPLSKLVRIAEHTPSSIGAALADPRVRAPWERRAPRGLGRAGSRLDVGDGPGDGLIHGQGDRFPMVRHREGLAREQLGGCIRRLHLDSEPAAPE